MATGITASVGRFDDGSRECFNIVADQIVVITALNAIDDGNGGTRKAPLATAALRNGKSSDALAAAILTFQNSQVDLTPDGHVDPGGQTIRTLLLLSQTKPNNTVTPAASDPATDPAEAFKVDDLLRELRPTLPSLVASGVRVLKQSQAALQLARSDPFRAATALASNRNGIDGLFRHFKVSGGNVDVVDQIIAQYSAIAAKFVRLPIDQIATDYPTFVATDPGNALNQDGTAKTTIATSRPDIQKMFFNPIFRRFDPTQKVPFTGFFDVILRSVQIHEMCHCYFGMVDGNPALSSTAQCLNLAQSFGNFLTQVNLNRPFPS